MRFAGGLLSGGVLGRVSASDAPEGCCAFLAGRKREETACVPRVSPGWPVGAKLPERPSNKGNPCVPQNSPPDTLVGWGYFAAVVGVSAHWLDKEKPLQIQGFY